MEQQEIKPTEIQTESPYRKRITTGLLVLLLVLVAMIPVSIWMNKARNIEKGISEQNLMGLTTDISVNIDSFEATKPVSLSFEGKRSAYYPAAGVELLIPTRNNWKTFSDNDWETLGKAPWALLNTVHANLDYPALILHTFNKPQVIKGFMTRADVKGILGTPASLNATIKNEAALQKFFNYNSVKAALNSPKAIEAIANSGLAAAVLNTKSMQSLINNPRTAAQLINASPTLKALKSNPEIQKALKTNKATSKVAATILR